jgi:hypothetical protein
VPARRAAEIVDFNPFLINEDYIILRNPWGYCEGTASALNGTIPVRGRQLLALDQPRRRGRRVRDHGKRLQALFRRHRRRACSTSRALGLRS